MPKSTVAEALSGDEGLEIVSGAMTTFSVANDFNKDLNGLNQTEEELGTVVMTNGTGEHEGEVRYPRPSMDPNDPLNWSRRAKMASYLPLAVFAFLANLNSVCFQPALAAIALEFQVSTTQASFIISLGVLMLGIGNLFWVPFMRKFGKRPMFLTACSIVVITNICTPFAKSYGGLLAARIISNFCAGSADATVPSFVGETFFLHERGACMMIFHIFLSMAFFIGPLITGWITATGGWRWTVGFMGFALFGNLLAMVFFLRESAYVRNYTNNGPFEKRTYLQWLSVTLGYRREVNPLKVFYEIVRLVIYPPIMWVGLLIGVVSGATVMESVVSSLRLRSQPYFFNSGLVGTFQVAGFVGAMIGFFLGGRLIDYLAASFTRRNRGVREPEMRLPALLIPGFCGTVGMIIMGVCFQDSLAWIGSATGLALVGLCITCTNNIGVTYAVDSYLAFSGEVITVVFVIRNTISCLVALYSNAWATNVGYTNSFCTMAAIEGFFFLVGILIYFYGKRIRTFTARYGPVREMTRRVHHE